MVDHADVKKRPLKTFGKRPCTVEKPSIQRSSSIDMILGDENEKLQAQINQMIQDDMAPKKSKLAPRSDFMAELDNLSSDEEFDEIAHGIKKPKNVKSVHELVEAGENSRFFDEIEYLVEGLCSGSEESRTLSLEELTQKVFCTPGFGGRMRAHGKLEMTIDRSFGLVHKSRVRECLALLLINLCHELRKLDAFISVERLVFLSKQLIQENANLSNKNLVYLKQTQVFKDLRFDECPVRVLGLWLLAKVCQSTSQSGTKDEINSLIEQLTDSGIEPSLIEMFSTSPDELTVFGAIQLRWCLVPLQFAFMQSLLENASLLGDFLGGIWYGKSQTSLLSLDIARVLVCLTGPDANHAILAKDEKFIKSMTECIKKKTIFPQDDRVPVAICLVSAMVNLVDRSQELAKSLTWTSLSIDLLCRLKEYPPVSDVSGLYNFTKTHFVGIKNACWAFVSFHRLCSG